jgi:hypothetical protein
MNLHWNEGPFDLEDGRLIYVCSDYCEDFEIDGLSLIVGCTKPDTSFVTVGVGKGVWNASDGSVWDTIYPLKLPIRRIGLRVIEDWRL